MAQYQIYQVFFFSTGINWYASKNVITARDPSFSVAITESTESLVISAKWNIYGDFFCKTEQTV